MPLSLWSPDTLRALNHQFEDASPRTMMQWAFESFGHGAVLGTGFGPSGIVLLHLLSRLRPNTTVFYLDTGLLFPETLALRDRLAEDLGLTFTAITPALSLDEQEAQYGPALWEQTPDACCALRKVAPLRRFLRDKAAWISGPRRDQAATRRALRLIDWDPTCEVLKVHPLAAWTADDVWGYIHLHDLPYNPLHDDGYPSIGCRPCTRPVAPGQDERAGRWTGQDKTECGIHLPILRR